MFWIIFWVYVSKSEFNFITDSHQTNKWEYFCFCIWQKLCVLSCLEFIVHIIFDCFCFSVHCDSHKIIEGFESISLFYIFGESVTIWIIKNMVILILIIISIVFVINDSDGNGFCHFNYSHMKSELNIEKNFLKECERIKKICFFCSSEILTIEIEITWCWLIFAFLH